MKHTASIKNMQESYIISSYNHGIYEVLPGTIGFLSKKYIAIFAEYVTIMSYWNWKGLS
jgi:hypothetical protein